MQRKQEKAHQYHEIESYNQQLSSIRNREKSTKNADGAYVYHYLKRDEEQDKQEKAKQAEQKRLLQANLLQQMEEQKRRKQEERDRQIKMEQLAEIKLKRDLQGSRDSSRASSLPTRRKQSEKHTTVASRVAPSQRMISIDDIQDSISVVLQRRNQQPDVNAQQSRQIEELKEQLRKNEQHIQSQIKEIVEFTKQTQKQKESLDLMKRNLMPTIINRPNPQRSLTLDLSDLIEAPIHDPIKRHEPFEPEIESTSHFVHPFKYWKLAGQNRVFELLHHGVHPKDHGILMEVRESNLLSEAESQASLGSETDYQQIMADNAGRLARLRKQS